MFHDPLVAVMSMLILCFMGILVMFVFFIRFFSGQAEAMREGFRKQQDFLADIEGQTREITFALRSLQGKNISVDTRNASSGHATADVEKLSFLQEDPLVSMVQPATAFSGRDIPMPGDCAAPLAPLDLSPSSGKCSSSIDLSVFETATPARSRIFCDPAKADREKNRERRPFFSLGLDE